VVRRWVGSRSPYLGQGLSALFGPTTGPTAFIAPVYPILVAGVFRVFGTYSFSSAVVIIVAQILINLVTVFLITRLSLRLFDARVANMAGFFWACSLPLIWIPSIFWETSISICVVVGLVLLALNCRERQTKTIWVAMGASCGFAALVNLALSPSVLAVFAWAAVRRVKTHRLSPLVGLLVFTVVFAPWPIRNALVFHAFVPTRTTVGFELWMGNHPGSSGYLDESLFPAFNQKRVG
jgi:4-amino-4-deoxy-L-arabinose transferase-like glycosyltransferase